MSGKDFQDFVVVVTGASTGLGRAIAVETASRGAQAVIINYASSAQEAAETARQVEAQGAGGCNEHAAPLIQSTARTQLERV